MESTELERNDRLLTDPSVWMSAWSRMVTDMDAKDSNPGTGGLLAGPFLWIQRSPNPRPGMPL